MANNSASLGTASISSLLVKQAVPASIGILVMSLNMIVDTIFVGRWIGPLAISAITVVIPVTFFIAAIGLAVGIGGSSATNDNGEAWYAAIKDIENNTLVVVQGHDHQALMSTTLIAQTCDWVSGHFPEIGKPYRAKTRYRQADQPCEITAINGDKITVKFTEQQRAVTPGQALVMYDDNICLGGATIVSAT